MGGGGVGWGGGGGGVGGGGGEGGGGVGGAVFRLLHHLARASCHIAENPSNSALPLARHPQAQGEPLYLHTTTSQDRPAAQSHHRQARVCVCARVYVCV